MNSRTLLTALALVAGPACNVITPDLIDDIPTVDAPPVVPVFDARPPEIDAPPVVPDSGGLVTRDMLVTEYLFEDESGTQATDTTSRQLHGLLSDPAMSVAPGRNGRAISMSGLNPPTQYVSLPNDLLLGVNDFTISVWVRLTGNTAWSRIYDIGNGQPDPANRFMYLTVNGFTPAGQPNGIHAASYGGSAENELFVGTRTALPLNVWKHVALTGSGGNRTIWIDGFPAAAITNGPAIAPNEMEPIFPNSWLGRSRFTADPGLAGLMDEFRIYGRVLNATEIADLAWPKRDYSYWRFDEAGGSVTRDSSDINLATALAGGATWTTGRLGGAVGFGGGPAGDSGPHVVIAGNPFAGCANQLTVSAWLRLNALTPGARLWDFTIGDTHALYLAPTDGTGMHFGMRSPAGTFDMVHPQTIVKGDAIWHHVAVTVDAGNIVTLFIDGTSVRTLPASGVRPSDFTGVTEGYLGRSLAGDPYLDGAIDELRIACRAFTPDELRNLSRP
jgi:hypothetical protein